MKRPSLRDIDDYIDDLEMEIKELKTQISGLEVTIEMKDSEIDRLNDGIKEFFTP